MSSEYETLVRHSADLHLAVKMQLVSLGAKLVSAELITPDQYQEIRNRSIVLEAPTAHLVDLLQVRVQQHPRWYDVFIAILDEDYSLYGGIVEELQKTCRKMQRSPASTHNTRNRRPRRARVLSSAEYKTLNRHTI